MWREAILLNLVKAVVRLQEKRRCHVERGELVLLSGSRDEASKKKRQCHIERANLLNLVEVVMRLREEDTMPRGESTLFYACHL